KKTKEFIRIDVVNFGTVIAKDQLKHVFNRFYQGNQDEHKEGSGIGLALTKRLVNLHKGKITVKSSETKGTRFRVHLPLGDEHLTSEERIDCGDQNNKANRDQNQYRETELRANIPTEPSPVENTTINSKQEADQYSQLPSLLIVEDSLDVQNFIKEIFISKYKIFLAQNGKEAINIAQNNHIELIISDVNMPVMDGFELCKTIKTNIITSHIMVILLTAKVSPTHQKKGFDTGADAYITKPFKANILESRV